jgi:hypothetical protein
VSSDPRPPLTTTTSLKPAATVLIIAALTLLTFIGVDVWTSQSSPTTTTIPLIVGGLPIDASNTLIEPCQQPDVPPNNINDSFFLPAATTSLGPIINQSSGAGGFDCERTFVTPDSQSAVLGFYKSQLIARGWGEFSHGAKNGNGQLLFQKNGTDTFLWVLGITIDHHAKSSATWTFRLYQDSSGI